MTNVEKASNEDHKMCKDALGYIKDPHRGNIMLNIGKS